MADRCDLSFSDVQFGYPGGPLFLGPINLTLGGGKMLAIVGPNGAGKSTLLRLGAGLLWPRAGSVSVAGRPIGALRRAEQARTIAFLPQHCDVPEDLPTRDVVLLGRFPHRNYRFFDSAEDHRITEQAMRTTDTLQFADRALGTLSAGERQRVHLAAAVAQRPRLLMLDEPTAALDPYHQIQVFGMLGTLCRDEGVGIVVVTHDLNLAGRYADSVLLLRDGRTVAIGEPRQVLSPERLRLVYGVAFETYEGVSDGFRRVFPVPQSGAGSE